MIDPTDATTVPKEMRGEVFHEVMVALEKALDERHVRLDLFGRLELLDLALDELEASFDPPHRH